MCTNPWSAKKIVVHNLKILSLLKDISDITVATHGYFDSTSKKAKMTYNLEK
jgi:hypothetical protein